MTTPTIDRPPTRVDLERPRPNNRILILLLVVLGGVVVTAGILLSGLGGDQEQPAGEVPTTIPPEATDAPDITYGEEPRANWDVSGVKPDGSLNVREGPGVGAAIAATLPPTAAELESTGRIARVDEVLWREIVIPGDATGWVNAHFLTETAPPAPEIRFGEEPRANWDVTGVASDDVLNVRAGPGVVGVIVATLPPTAAELESTGRIAWVDEVLWREFIVPGDGAGWVNAHFLMETTGTGSAS